MAYPKPLSEKSLEKKYREAGISAEARDFLHKLFAACANYYGVLCVSTVWDLCKELKGVPPLRKKDIFAFSSIVRREEQPYCVFEIDEIYYDAPRKESSRQIVAGELIGVGYGKFFFFDKLIEERSGRDLRLYDDLLAFADPVPSKYETALRSFLENLTSENDECVSHY